MAFSSDFAFLDGPAEVVAPQLLGRVLERTFENKTLSGIITEVEAYDQGDAASHSFKGRSARTEVMFSAPGYVYVYFTYGMHYCCNVVVGPKGTGAAVLIRALEPVAGVSQMTDRRHGRAIHELTNGPAKLCQALSINTELNGHYLADTPLRLVPGRAINHHQIVQTTRIGISKAQELPWRFYIRDNPYVSRL
jgi:DNA-3-methyladenine glycosylase